MSDIEDLEARIAGALERIRAGVENLGTAVAPVDPGGESLEARVEQLSSMLEDEQRSAATAQAKLDAMMLKSGSATEALEERIASLTAELDGLEQENSTLRNTVNDLQGVNATLRDSAAAGVTEPDAINQSLMADLKALQTSRASEIRDMESILSDLAPILEEAPHA
jgi:predicted  nucleic acid-binding Zn-ribbon protein